MRLLAAVVVAVLAAPAAAQAATVSSKPSPSRYYLPQMTFEAAADEVNDVTVSGPDDERRVVDAGAPLAAGAGCRQVTEHEAVCENATEMRIELGDRDDRGSLEAVDGSGSYLLGGAGDDILTGGPGSESLSGGDGRDTIAGGAGHDDVAGDDGTPFADRLDGGPGNDDVEYASHPVGVRVDLSDPSAPAGAPGEGDTQVRFESIRAGSGGPNELTGDDGPNSITSGAPGSHVAGGGGNDFVEALGDSTVDGGPGNDRVGSRASGRSVCGTGVDELLGSGGYRRYGWFVTGYGHVAGDCERLPIEFSDLDDALARPLPTLRGSRATFRVSCPALDPPEVCKGLVRLRDTRGRLLGERRYRTRERRTPAVGVHLSEKTLRRIARPGGLDARVFVRIDASGGDAAERADASWSVTLGG